MPQANQPTPNLHFNHMELTLPTGTLTDEWIAELEAFYGELFGWRGKRCRSLGGYLVDAGADQSQFLLLKDSDKHLLSQGMYQADPGVAQANQ